MNLYELAYVGLGVAIGSTVMAAALEFLQKAAQAGIEFGLRLIFIERTLENNRLADFMHMYLRQKGRSFGFKTQAYRTQLGPIKGERENKYVVFSDVRYSWRLYFFKGAPLIFQPRDITDDDDKENYSVWHLRGTVNWESLLCAVAELGNSLESDRKVNTRHAVYHYFGTSHNEPKSPPEGVLEDSWNRFDSKVPLNYPREALGVDTPDKPIEALSMTPPMRLVVDRVKHWYQLQNWYEEGGIPWRFGVNLYGPPGCGKTSLARALGQELDLPIYVLHLSSMSDHDFNNTWTLVRQVEGDLPRIVLLEDIDAVFEGRENVSKNSDLSFDVLLNAIDGIDRNSGMLLFITTNRIECIDPALGAPDPSRPYGSTRPGRIDLVVELGAMDAAGRAKMARRIIRDPVLEAKVLLENEDMPAAQFQDVCIRAALTQKWGNQ